MAIGEKIQEQIKGQAKIKYELNLDLSEAIAKVLENYGLTGKYRFNVRRDLDYGHEPIKQLNGKELILPLWAMGSGYATVEEQRKVGPI